MYSIWTCAGMPVQLDVWHRNADGSTSWDTTFQVATVGEAFQIIDLLGLAPMDW